MPRKISRCTKNYVNCRLHPESSLPLPVRVKVRTSYTHESARESFDKLTAYIEEEGEGLAPEELHAAKQYRHEAALLYQASMPDSHYKSSQHLLTGEAITREQRLQAHRLRRSIMQDHADAIMHDQLYERDQPPLTPFETAVAAALVQSGDFRRLRRHENSEDEGSSLSPSANEHFRECGVRKVHECHESQPSIDGERREFKAVMSCNCGHHYREAAYAKNQDGEFMSNLLNGAHDTD